jgi:hypothetical protein
MIFNFLKSFLKNSILKEGYAERIIFFYLGEEGTYINHPHITIYENGIIHVKTENEELTTHLQNCEIVWKVMDEEKKSKKIHILQKNSTIE